MSPWRNDNMIVVLGTGQGGSFGSGPTDPLTGHTSM